VCPLHVYHFIKETKTWEEAQRYCREHYTDLATVYDMNDTQRLNDSVNTGEAWIGLHSNIRQENRVWHWSLPGVEVTKYFWAQQEPNDNDGTDNCVVIKNNEWHDHRCSHKRAFICYDEKQYIFHDDKKTWSEAQEYCREKHTDLVSGLHQLVDRKLRSEIQNQKNKNSFYWIGLFTDGWGWSDGSKASFRNWKSFEDDNIKNGTLVIVIRKNPSSTWEEASDYCIKNHRGLVSITDSSQQRWAAEKAKEADTGYVWLGLRYTCVLDLWFWVNDELVCYKNWASDEEPVEWCDRAVAMSKGEGHEWHTKADNEKFNFICALH
uniref:C-type lectin domain-containing protein n=1 Tax=Sparus aurata TaxID=8175 RepID=A0A671XGM8_SPAAU